MSLAEQIAERFNHDGQSYLDAEGVHITDVLEGKRLHRLVKGAAVRYELLDGSAIVDCGGGGWDLGYPGLDRECFCWACEGHHPECEGILTDEEQGIIRSAAEGHLAKYLTADHGSTFGVYPDGKVLVGEDVGKEIDPSERPLATTTCPGMGNLDLSYYRNGWECAHLSDEEVIADCCENGDVCDETEDLIQALTRDVVSGRTR